MGLIAQIQQDIKNIVSNGNEFGVPIQFIAPTGQTQTINGLHTRHNLSIEQRENNLSQYGNIHVRGNSIIAHVSISESQLTDLAYPTRVNGNVNFKDHKVNVADSSGLMRNYIVMEFYPDETIGLIVLILNDFDA